MFDKLIETEPAGADFKNRRKYFMVSSVCVGILFVTAVVFSIYAADIGLGNRDFELVEMIAPPEMAPNEPQPEPERPRNQTQSQTQVATRQVNMARVDEFINEIPTTISTTRNAQAERPKYGHFEIGPLTTEAVGGSIGRNTGSTDIGGPGIATSQPVGEIEKDVEPPPTIKKNPPPTKPVSGGVVNGNAINLPKPEYPATAKAVGAHGLVQVQVTIDESGRVTSANAVSGHPMLRHPAEAAARRATFSPTKLSGVAVKVTGIINYNFTR